MPPFKWFGSAQIALKTFCMASSLDIAMHTSTTICEIKLGDRILPSSHFKKSKDDMPSQQGSCLKFL